MSAETGEFDFAPADALIGRTPDARSRDVFSKLVLDLGCDLETRFKAGIEIGLIVSDRSRAISNILERSWRLFDLHGSGHALAAVGGFGRGELHPYSDIDIAVILETSVDDATRLKLEQWIAFLWDIGLEVGQSVRTVEECELEARADASIATTLMESRLIAGSAKPFEAMKYATSPRKIWPAAEFFEAKLREQHARYRKFDDAFGQLEPNLKDGPGGLRDIQLISWVANRHFESAGLDELVTHGFLTDEELSALDAGRSFLWTVRCALHFAAGRREDRLLFDHQKTVAVLFGYEGDGSDAVEQFMRLYYKTVRELAILNDLLLALFQEAILEEESGTVIVSLNRRFQTRNAYIEAREPNVFDQRPHALLEVFLLIQKNPEIKGVRASTLRLIRQHLHLIDDAFRADIRSRSLFLEIIRQPDRIGHELQRMHRYGVLDAYLPVFAHVSGLMQFDLFHVLTVDEHALLVVRTMRRFSRPERDEDQPPHCREVIERIPKLEILYIAGLFHDIAKGRGGDHSELGAEEAVEFCRAHGFSNYDTHLVAWLVRNHLLMSATAHRKDIYDSAVILEFAREMGDLVHLDYLYLLTVADIRATNPKLWTSWKASLLSELFIATRRFMRSRAESPPDIDEQRAAVQLEAKQWMARRHTRVAIGKLERFWQSLDAAYFVRHRADEIGWHAEIVTAATPEDIPMVAVRDVPERGCTAVFVYAEDMDNLFAITTGAMGRLRLDIQDARIMTTDAGYTLDTYMVLEAESRGGIDGTERRLEIQQKIRAAIRTKMLAPAHREVGLRRKNRHFPFEPTVEFSRDKKNSRTVMEVIAVDQAGLLSNIGIAMDECKVRLIDARIATFGERVEDYFYISDRVNRPISDSKQQQKLRDLIVELLS